MKPILQPTQKAALIVLLTITALQHNASAQTVLVAPEVWSCTGDQFAANGIVMGWTVGEVATDTYEGPVYTLTQGFHQSEDMYLNVLNVKQQQLVITPNGDGLNDALILEDILNYPKNELIVLNRWGGTVFEAKPYLNDWRGISQSGKPLPEATYYYLVKLEIGRGELLYGSITIKR